MRLIFCAVLALALGGHAHAQSALYGLKSLPDGAAYLGSDIFKSGPKPDFSQAALDQALDVNAQQVRHVPTGLVFPLRAGPCELANFMGLRAPDKPSWMTFKSGGRGYYACDPAQGPAFVVFSFESDFAEAKTFRGADALGEALLAGGMLNGRDPKGKLACEPATAAEPRQVACVAHGVLDGRPYQERGAAFIRDDSFVKFNIACLDEGCPRAEEGLRALISAVDVSRLTEDAARP
ncbi:MAG: hypothetical protein ABW360_12450 [Phenylobacterium sp.]